MESLLILVHVLAAIVIIVLVLMQRGRGADMGASFGSGSSQTLFGSSGSGNMLTKSTTVFAVVFFLTSLTLAVIARQTADSGDSPLIEDQSAVTEQTQTDTGGGDSGASQTQDDDIPQTGEDIPQAQGDAAPQTDTGGDIPVAPSD